MFFYWVSNLFKFYQEKQTITYYLQMKIKSTEKISCQSNGWKILCSNKWYVSVWNFLRFTLICICIYIDSESMGGEMGWYCSSYHFCFLTKEMKIWSVVFVSKNWNSIYSVCFFIIHIDFNFYETAKAQNQYINEFVCQIY